jgi:hypothetical protein
METMPPELQALLDREAIRNCIIRLARGEDRRDADQITSAYWPDSTTDYGVFAGDFAAYLDWVVPGSPALPVTQHVLGQSHVELAGDIAKAETHVVSYHRVKYAEEDQRDTCIGGRYLDELAKRNGEWRIAKRTMLYDWFQEFGASIDWAQGVMGMPFSAGHYTGRADGDYSVTFFGPPR